MDLLIPSATGLEAVVERQLGALGYLDCKANSGRVLVKNSSWQDVARINMFIRSGERVLINLATFSSKTFDQLYEGVYAVDWQAYIEKGGRVTVITKSVRSTLTAHHSIQAIGKKAIVCKLSPNGVWDEFTAEYVVELDITDDICRVNLDTTGDGLHKRGYRSLAYSAPLKETTASALIDLSVWHGDKVFTDLFCGSGTLPIEAALKALKIAPGINRHFAYEKWQTAEKGIFSKALEEANDVRIDRKLEIIGGDISSEALSIAKYHAKRAGVESYIKFNERSAFDFVSKSSYGVNISNPPYGERLGDKKEAEETAVKLGKLYKSLDKWNFYFITPIENFERLFGRRADKKRYIFNAGIKCSYYSFNGPKPPKDEYKK